jgi:hypothetical protein
MRRRGSGPDEALATDEEQARGLAVLLLDGCRCDAEADRDLSDFC